MTIETKFNVGDTVYVDRPFSQWWPSLKTVMTIGEIKISTYPKLIIEYRARQSRRGIWFSESWCKLKECGEESHV